MKLRFSICFSQHSFDARDDSFFFFPPYIHLVQTEEEEANLVVIFFILFSFFASPQSFYTLPLSNEHGIPSGLK